MHEHAALVMSVQATPQLAPWKATLTTGGVGVGVVEDALQLLQRRHAPVGVAGEAGAVQVGRQRPDRRRGAAGAVAADALSQPVVPPSALAAHSVAAAAVGWQNLLVVTEHVPDHL